MNVFCCQESQLYVGWGGDGVWGEKKIEKAEGK